MDDRWLITGASGQLGGHIVHELMSGNDVPDACVLGGTREMIPGGDERRHVDLADHAALAACVRSFRPSHIVHLGAMTAVAEAAARPADAEKINAGSTRVLAEEAERIGARLIYSSTDMVFAGDRAPYREDDPPAPLSVYGRTKAEGERELLRRVRTLVVRIPLMFGVPLTKRPCTFMNQLAALQAGEPLNLFTDEYRTPIWLVDAARAIIALARSDVTGIVHVAGPERLSRYAMIERVAALLGIKNAKLVGVSRNSVPGSEPRPEDLSLIGERFNTMFPAMAPRPLGPQTPLE